MRPLKFRIINGVFFGTGILTPLMKYPWNVAVLVIGLVIGYALTYFWFPEFAETNV